MTRSERTSRRALELADGIPVTAITQHLVRSVVDVFRKELHGTIAHHERCTTGMLRLEALARRPVLPVIAAGEARCETGRRRTGIPAGLANTENLEIDRRRRGDPQRVEVHPAVAGVVAAIRTNFPRQDDVRRPVGEIP